MKRQLASLAIMMALPLTANAAANFVEGDATLAGEAEFGATLTTGNTDTSSAKAKLKLKHELADWENVYLLEGLYKEDEDEVTAKRYFVGFQGNYKFDEVSYMFAGANYEVDPFTGYDYKVSGATGYGHKFITSENSTLKLEVGPGYIYQRLDSEQEAEKGYSSDDSLVLHGVVNFEANISDSSKFKQEIIADYGDSLIARSETSITASIVGALAMKFAVVVRYNNEALEGKKSTDTETNMTLLYSF